MLVLPDAATISQPYRREEEPRAVPAADPPDSAWPEDAAAEKDRMARSAHPAESSADEAAKECSANSAPKASARRA